MLLARKPDAKSIRPSAGDVVVGMLSFEKDCDDRVLAIRGAALAEAALTDFLAKHLNPHSQEKDTALLGAGGALGSFAHKIASSFAFGWIDRAMADELTAIRHVRNRFAHAVTDLDFSDARIRPLCARLRFPELDDRSRYYETCNDLYVALTFRWSEERVVSAGAGIQVVVEPDEL